MRPIVSTLLFLAVVSSVLGGLHYYLYVRLIRGPELGPALQRPMSWAIVLLALLVPTSFIVGRTLSGPAAKLLSFVALSWFGLVILMFFMLVATELLRVGVHLWTSVADVRFDAERRQFLTRGIAAAVAGAGVLLGGTGMANALGTVAVQRVRVGLARFPPALDGFKLVQLTDVHMGPTLGADWLRDIVARVNALEPDVIAITGDLVDGSVERLRDQVAPLAELKAKYGVFFVTGNHEYYSGAEAWSAHLATLGIRVLRNERVSVGDADASFDLAGVDDYGTRRSSPDKARDVERATEGRDETRELVLLAHQPKHVEEAAAAGVGLQLSGHTHGGQIFPWGYFVRLDQPFLSGLGRRDNTQIYVSRGTGFWGPPMRVGAPAEITLLELRHGDAATSAILSS